jgi:hypothetical protein
VNVFWTHPAQRELALIRQLLIGKGELYLFYDSPEPARIRRLSRLLAEHLEQARYTHSLVTTMLTSSTVIGLKCRPLPIPDPRKEENP